MIGPKIAFDIFIYSVKNIVKLDILFKRSNI